MTLVWLTALLLQRDEPLLLLSQVIQKVLVSDVLLNFFYICLCCISSIFLHWSQRGIFRNNSETNYLPRAIHISCLKLMSKVCCTKNKCSVFLSLRFQVAYDVQHFFAVYLCNLKERKLKEKTLLLSACLVYQRKWSQTHEQNTVLFEHREFIPHVSATERHEELTYVSSDHFSVIVFFGTIFHFAQLSKIHTGNSLQLHRRFPSKFWKAYLKVVPIPGSK